MLYIILEKKSAPTRDATIAGTADAAEEGTVGSAESDYKPAQKEI